MKRDGHSAVDIVKRMGIPKTLYWGWMMKNKIQISDNDIIDLIREGTTEKEISDLSGISLFSLRVKISQLKEEGFL